MVFAVAETTVRSLAALVAAGLAATLVRVAAAVRRIPEAAVAVALATPEVAAAALPDSFLFDTTCRKRSRLWNTGHLFAMV